MASLPTDCPATCGFTAWRWTQHWFGDCVCSTRDEVSFVLGLTSVIAWGIAEIPQIITNFRTGKSDGISFAFVATWLTGDVLNLVGCVVSPTLPMQLYTAIVYTATTIVLIGQHLLFSGRNGDEGHDGSIDDSREQPLLGEEEELQTHPPPDVESIAVRASQQMGTGSPTRVGARAIRDTRQKRDSVHLMQSPSGPSSARTFVHMGSWGGAPGSLFGRDNGRSVSNHARTSHHHSPRVGRGNGEGVSDTTHTTPQSVNSANAPPRHGASSSSRPPRSSSSSRTTLLATATAALGVVAIVNVTTLRYSSYLTDTDTGGDMSMSSFEDTGGDTSIASYESGYESSIGTSGFLGDSFQSAMTARSGNNATSGSGKSPGDGYAHAPLVKAPPWLGLTLGWSTVFIYSTGRLCQIQMNHTKQYVEGLSVSMFVLAVVGNFTYAASIVARSSRWSRLAPNLPWLVDACACLLMDAVILAQFFWYSGATSAKSQGGGPRTGDNTFGNDIGDDDTIDGLRVSYVPLHGSESEDDSELWDE